MYNDRISEHKKTKDKYFVGLLDSNLGKIESCRNVLPHDVKTFAHVFVVFFIAYKIVPSFMLWLHHLVPRDDTAL